MPEGADAEARPLRKLADLPSLLLVHIHEDDVNPSRRERVKRLAELFLPQAFRAAPSVLKEQRRQQTAGLLASYERTENELALGDLAVLEVHEHRRIVVRHSDLLNAKRVVRGRDNQRTRLRLVVAADRARI